MFNIGTYLALRLSVGFAKLKVSEGPKKPPEFNGVCYHDTCK